MKPFTVPTPWWPDVEPIVREVRHRFGLTVTVLRLVRAEPHLRAGGHVTYLAEVDPSSVVELDLSSAAESWLSAAGSDSRVGPWSDSLEEHPLRQTWARPGGPAADLAWASSVLADQGITPTGPPEQIKTWNLSSLWRLSTSAGQVWVKVVPPFFSHEGSLMARLSQLAPDSVPRLLGHEGARSLMADIPGVDQFDPPEPLLPRMVTLLVDLQRWSMERIGEFLAMGLPDRRGPALIEAIASVIDRTGPDLSRAQRSVLDRFVHELQGRFADIDDCGLPDTLVHGDFHPGNVRSAGKDLVLLDWGDSGVGHPLLDRAAFLDRIPADVVGRVTNHWDHVWREAVPGCDPVRAARLLDPVASARQAVIYRYFLDRIEPSEHPYHQSDPLEWLGRTVVLLSEEGDLSTD